MMVCGWAMARGINYLARQCIAVPSAGFHNVPIQTGRDA
jgi:hypothetical protein